MISVYLCRHPIGFCTAQREAAIVTAIPGTTRDILSVSVDIGGLPIIISDAAGLRQTNDLVEKIGVQRAHQAFVFTSLTIDLFFSLVLKMQTYGSVCYLCRRSFPSYSQTRHGRT
jgi:GTPase Era involved in 16S rRNA processing